MPKIPTLKIKRDGDESGYAIINRADFDPATQEEFGGVKKPTAQKAATKKTVPKTKTQKAD